MIADLGLRWRPRSIQAGAADHSPQHVFEYYIKHDKVKFFVCNAGFSLRRKGMECFLNEQKMYPGIVLGRACCRISA